MHKPIMTNPWLQIPASDYEVHMSSPNVAQQSFLAQTFKESLESQDSSTIALYGCATEWVFVEAESGRPKMIPEEIIRLFPLAEENEEP